MKLFVLIFLVLFAQQAMLFSMDYYVDAVKGSNSNSGSSKDKAWLTITYAFSQVEGIAQDPVTINVLDGTYNTDLGETFPLVIENYITLSGENKITTIIDGTGIDDSVISCNNINNFEIESLTITGGNRISGIYPHGGGFRLLNSSGTINNCYIFDNHATEHGGGVYCDDSDLIISNSIFESNTCNHGGGLYFNSSSITINNSEFKNNIAKYDGGAIRSQISSVDISSCIINNNTANGNGGGIVLWDNDTVNIIDCEINNNWTTDSGGGIYSYSSTLVIISDSAISNNTSNLGAGLALTASGIELYDSIISDNHANYDGGGIRCFYTDSLIENSLITGNYAEDNGGGIVCWNKSKANIKNCLIELNSTNLSTGKGGGFFANTDSSYLISNCTFANNEAFEGGGIKGEMPPNLSLVLNCIIWDNKGGSVSGTTTIEYSDVEGGCSGEGNIDEDPLFVSCPTGIYYLSQTASGQTENSPCLDAGSDTAQNLGFDKKTTRTDGNPDAGKVDLGFHYKTTNTITPTATLTKTPTFCPTNTPTLTPSFTITPTITITPTLTPTKTFTPGVTATPTKTITTTISQTQTPTITPTITQTIPPTDYYVDSVNGDNCYSGKSEHEAWKTITYALTQVEGTSTQPVKINVASGIYSLVSGETFPIKMEGHTTLTGDDRDTTIIDGSRSDNSVFYCYGKEDSRIESIAITGGTGTLWQYNWLYGGGIFCSKSTMGIYNCLFRDNLAFDTGGGFYCVDSDIVISNCEFMSNESHLGAGIMAVTTSLLVSDCYLHDNFTQYDGGGIRCERAISTEIINCEISDNIALSKGGGIVCWNHSPPYIKNCLIKSNGASSSSFGKGGGIYCDTGSPPIIVNCSILENAAYQGGGIFTMKYSVPLIINSIIWNNMSECINGDAIVTYSDVQRGYPGTGNIAEDPLFVLGPNGDYYLSQLEAGQSFASPCVDSGSNTAVNELLHTKTTRTDGIGDSRIVDMGYHYRISGRPIPESMNRMSEFSQADNIPTFSNQHVFPFEGNQLTNFEFFVHYYDPYNNSPIMKRIYVNNISKKMTLYYGNPWNGWYYCSVPAEELSDGSNDFYFQFTDSKGNTVKHGSFEGPHIEFQIEPTTTPSPSYPGNIPTQTAEATSTFTITVTPVLTSTPTETIEHSECLIIASPENFYYNTLLLCWTPINKADHYIFEYKNGDQIDTVILGDNWLRMIAADTNQWTALSSMGTIEYRITAANDREEVVEGPTDWTKFTCHPYGAYNSSDKDNQYLNKATDSGCLSICNPPDFYNNTILLSWTPISGADHYILKYRYSTWLFQENVVENYIYLFFPDESGWNEIKRIGDIFYSVSAVDVNDDVIDGPTPWTSFRCY